MSNHNDDEFDDIDEPIRAEREIVRFFDGLEVEGYRMPNLEFRVGLSGASRVLGYDRDWLRDILQTNARTVKSLRGLGFSEQTQKVTAQSKHQNSFEDTTISLDDFNRLIVYATSKGKKAALALQLSFTKMALNDFFRDAFGEPPLSIDQKRQLFYETYAASISPEDWRRMDKQDILKLALPGDEPHLRKGRWNGWRDDD
jgi:hypothetical protein